MASIEDLKSIIKDTPISEIIAKYVHVERKGRQTLAICPFHDDHKPSLTIDDTKSMFYCFVDQTGGDAINFVKLYLNVSYIESLKDIADKLGLNFEQFDSQKKTSPKIKEGYYLLDKTAQLYCKLSQSSMKNIFNNFLKERNIPIEIAKKYRLGATPNNNVLMSYINSIDDKDKRSKALKMAKDLSLIRTNKIDNSKYDQFRNRITFPIWDQFGNIIGFTSRAIKDYQKAKYLNSVESFLFKKREILYGLHFAKSKIRQSKQIIIVEGNMDQISLTKAEFENSVAIMGTAMSENSIKMISSMAEEVFLALDNDSAGQLASEKISEEFLKNNIFARRINLSPCKDPDEFINKLGSLEFQKRCDQSIIFLDYQLQQLIPEKVPYLTGQRLKILKKIYLKLLNVQDDLEIKARLITLAQRLNLSLDAISLFEGFLDFKSKRPKPPQAHVSYKETSLNFSENITDSYSALSSLDDSSDNTMYPLLNSISEDKNNAVDSTLNLLETNQEIILTACEKIILRQITLNTEMLTLCDVKKLLEFTTNSDVECFVLDFNDFLLEIDDQLYQETLLNWMRSRNTPNYLTNFIGASLFKYNNFNSNTKILKKLIKDLFFNLKHEKFKEERLRLVNKLNKSNNNEELLESLDTLKEIDLQISFHRKNKKIFKVDFKK